MKSKTSITGVFMFLSFISISILNAQDIVVAKETILNPDYSEIQAAVDSAADGDVIYVYPGTYNGFTIKHKGLVLIGPGYFLAENPQTQANPFQATIAGEILIDSNATGTSIQGFQCNNNILIRNTDGVSIKRNRINAIDIENSNSITIAQNFITGTRSWASKMFSSLHINGSCVNIKISNNWIECGNTCWNASNYGCYGMNSFIHSEPNTYSILRNNTVHGNFYGHNLYMENNIHRNGSNVGCANCVFAHNISYDVQAFGLTNSNTVLPMDTIFIGSGSTDGKWMIKPGSPAHGRASDGGEPGMFGGPAPYVLSGMPGIPSIFYFEAPDNSSSDETLPIHIKVKSHP